MDDHLENMGYRVVMTRHRDRSTSLEKRSSLANRYRNALFVSIHFNAAANLKAKGIEIFYYDSHKNREKSIESKLLADSALAKIIHYTKALSRGVKRGNLHVIRETVMPSILIEGGFLSNESEVHRLKNRKYLNRLAWGAAKGIDHFVKSAV